MSETVVLWESFLQTNVCHKKQTSTCVICSFNVRFVMCCWNILHKNKWSSSAFKWNSWIWEDGHQAVASVLHEGTGKDGESDYSGCKDIHSELPLSHQLHRAKGIQGSKNMGTWYIYKTRASQCNRNKASSGIYTNNCIFLISKFEGNHNCMFPSQGQNQKKI